jgi:ADP-L-glycero-D-manno-heptose 6-epimerase
MKILVTGHNGFIGRNMVEWLSAEGWQVEGWDYDPENLPDVKKYQWVIHLGALTDKSNTDIDKFMIQNYEFSQWLFNECQLNEVHLQYASTSAVYGYGKDFSETAECKPLTPYAISKYVFDRWAFRQPAHSAFVHGFRYFNVYGKYMHLRGNQANIIYKWQEEARKTGQLSVWHTADQVKRDWVWVGDVCKVHIDFIKNVHGSGIWNVGSGLAHSYLDIAEAIAEQEDAVITVVESKGNDIRYKTCADLTLLKATIGKRQWLNVFEYINR